MTKVISEGYTTTQTPHKDLKWDNDASFTLSKSFDPVQKVSLTHTSDSGNSGHKYMVHHNGRYLGVARTPEEAAKKISDLGFTPPTKAHIAKHKKAMDDFHIAGGMDYDAMEDETLKHPHVIRRYSSKNESIEQMLTHILTGDMVESASSFKEILAEKVAAKLHESKMAIAQGLFVTEARATKASKVADAARYTAGDVFDPHAPKKAAPQERHAETGEDEYAKHPLRQLKAIGDWKENTPEESFEYTANGDIDKRSLAAYEARKAGKLKVGKYSKNEGISSDLPTFKHINGEESHVHPDDANHIVHVLSHPDVKPETKQAVITALHKSKDSFNHIKNALNVGRN